MNVRHFLKHALEIVAALLAAFHGFLLKISPPEEIQQWQSAASGISSFTLLIIFLLIAYFARRLGATKKYTRWMILVAVVCACVGITSFFGYQTETHRLTFLYPPPPPGALPAKLHVRGEVLTNDATTWRSDHPGITDSELVEAFGGIPDIDRVWTKDSVGKAETKLTALYVLFVVTLLTAVLSLLEGLLTTIASPSRRSGSTRLN